MPVPTSGSTPRWATARSAARRRHDRLPRGKALNLDALSLRQNWEMQSRIEDAAVADHFARELFDRDISDRRPGDDRSGWRDRVVNALMSAISPLL